MGLRATAPTLGWNWLDQPAQQAMDHYVNIEWRRAMEGNQLATVQQETNKMEANGFIDVDGHRPEEHFATPKSCCKGGFFADQFENLANFRAHYEWTGPEIWEQTGVILHAFVAAAGTGCTLAGVSRFLKEKDPNIKCYLIDLVEMSRFLLKNDGLFVGSSSAMNCVGAVGLARSLGPGHTIVTILCDSGMRHLSKFHSDQYLADYGLNPSATGLEFLDT